jgi:Outer membrane protein Omp28/Secretion system C-terminal sorting domain
MKKVFTIISFFCTLTVFGQAKKYALVEHFSNTLCSICAGTNPSFFSTVKVETNPNMHHISYYSAIPYSTCKFYVANKIPQDARATYYGLPGTPRASINGQALTALGNITEATVTQNAGSNALVSVNVTEVIGGTNTATIKVKAFQNIPTATYRLFVALVEKKVSYSAPNGEPTHYNVFRKFINLNGEAGDVVAAINTGAEITAAFSYTLDASWVATQIYAVAWVQNPTTKEVLNSGTRFDITSAVEEKPSIDAQVAVSPNPTIGKSLLTFDKLTPQYLTISNIAGQVFQNVRLAQSNSYELDIADLPKGIYIVKVYAKEGIALKKIVKE